jgi:hypothetical protein
MSRVSTWTIVREIVFILFGLLIIAGGLGRNGRWYLVLIGIGLIGWSLFRIFTEIEDSDRGGNVGRMSDEREEIRKRMKGGQ